jgi:ribosome biogenesis GTPase A
LSRRYGVPETGMEDEIAALLASGREEQDLPALSRREDAAAADEPQPDLLSLAILEAVGRRRGLLRKGGAVERDKTAAVLLDEVRGGKLGRITWEEPDEAEEGGGGKQDEE